MKIFNARSAFVVSLLAVSALGTAHAETTYVIAGSLIDPLNGKVVSNPVIEIQDDRIVSVTSGASVPAGARVIDVGDLTLLPGLADLHTHLAWDPTWR